MTAVRAQAPFADMQNTHISKYCVYVSVALLDVREILSLNRRPTHSGQIAVASGTRTHTSTQRAAEALCDNNKKKMHFEWLLAR